MLTHTPFPLDVGVVPLGESQGCVHCELCVKGIDTSWVVKGSEEMLTEAGL